MSRRRILRSLAVVLGYGALYAAFAVFSDPRNGPPGGAVWAPLTGLNLAILLLFGLSYVPVVLIATIGANFLSPPPSTLWQALAEGLPAVAAISLVAAWIRRVWFRNPHRVLPAVQGFAAGALVLAVVLGMFYAGRVIVAEHIAWTWPTLAGSTVSWSLREILGLLTLTPAVLLVAGPYARAPHEVLSWPQVPTRHGDYGILEATGLVLVLILVFVFPRAQGALLYLALLPLFGMAWRHGAAQAALGVFVFNAGLITALSLGRVAVASGDLQVGMLVLALTGLVVGALSSERTRTLAVFEERLRRRSNDLAQTRHELTYEIDQRRLAEKTLHESIEDLKTSHDALETAMEHQAELNEQLRLSEQQLQDLNARKDKFFSIVSHDLRNMLISAIGFSKLLISDAETLPRDMIKEFASHVHSSTTNTYDLLENLLTWTRMQTGRMYYQRSWHGVNDLIDNNIAMLQANAAQKGIELAGEADLHQDAQVYVDRNMISSVLQNLISNAIKFTQRGGKVTVLSRAYNNTVEIAVMDTGVGISPENIAKLFRIDAQVSSAGTEDEEGTGLGLVLCKEMIEKHEGTIWVESEVGKGSSFHFTLPAATGSA